ncbi:MAG: T9SS type A sorting domain-containing protein, partial [Candidatus Electryonea clarkiae]|nr:T9SS type A sorting domain-containing protein [Candidatus Electryonea clarkiae]
DDMNALGGMWISDKRVVSVDAFCNKLYSNIKDSLFIFNITDPSIPTSCNSFRIPENRSIKIFGNIAYQFPGLIIINMSDPDNPCIDDRFRDSRFGKIMEIGYPTAYASTGNRNIHLFDIEQLSTPEYISAIDLNHHDYDIYDLEAFGDWLFISSFESHSGGGVILIDVQNQFEPIELDRLWGDNPYGVLEREIEYHEGNLYFTHYPSNRRNPGRLYNVMVSENGVMELEEESILLRGIPKDMKHVGENLVIISQKVEPIYTDLFVIQVFDISDPGNPAESGYYERYGLATQIDVNESIAYIAETNTIGVYDLSEALTVNAKSNIPDEYYISLDPAFPNPFNSITNIGYTLPFASFSRITVYDILGKEVNILYEDFTLPGNYVIHWDGKDSNNYPVASGNYFIGLNSGGYNLSRKVTVLK